MAAWGEMGLPLEIMLPAKATPAELYATHNRSFVNRILNGVESNGFGTKQLEVAEACQYTVGGMITATMLAAINPNKYPVICVPVSGFHHAGWDFCGGYCTFNGLTAAALASNVRVLILDCDYHYGNGTDNIITKLRLSKVGQVSFGLGYSHPEYANGYLSDLDVVLSTFLRGVDVVIYQAGADAHVDDPLGGIFTTEQMLQRDTMVFEACKKKRVPVVWNLAGGYQTPLQKVIDLHTQTMQQCIKTYL